MQLYLILMFSAARSLRVCSNQDVCAAPKISFPHVHLAKHEYSAQVSVVENTNSAEPVGKELQMDVQGAIDIMLAGLGSPFRCSSRTCYYWNHNIDC